MLDFKLVPTALDAGGTYAMPIFFFRNGAGPPLVTRPAFAPPTLTGYPSRPIRLSSISKPTSFRCSAGLLLLRQHIAAREIALFQLADPSETGFQRRRRFVDFMPVEAHAGFQAQRIARSQPAGHQPEWLTALQQITPQLFGSAGSEVDLEAILTGVAGARDQASTPLTSPKAK